MIVQGMQVFDGIFRLSTVVLMDWIIFTRQALNAASAHGQIWNGKAMYFSNYIPLSYTPLNYTSVFFFFSLSYPHSIK